ncbi:MAG: nicotinate-nucleotide--dimethylbenzimidazole phosphoribosyltransferase [Eubacterium sp.]|nr:nicotinate-nucleotide--dimethylbenzimidazole phosphoribosyltransferase [Eubacterium sp.]
MTLKETLDRIVPLDREAMKKAADRWDAIAHPLHSLGKLEDVIVQAAGIQRTDRVDLKKKALITMCADNGVVEEGVTQTGQEVTAQVAENFLSEKATAGILCRYSNAEICPIDIGIYRDTRVRNMKVAYGTKNMTKRPAMTRQEAVRALEVGIQVAQEKKVQGFRVLATGEMGIGNTTTSSAICTVLLNQPVETMTGRGAGLSTEGLQRKISAIKKAIAVNQPDPDDALDVLSKVGGLDIAGMAGVFLGGAALGMPVVMDGFISCTAALIAARICPQAKDYMIASHVSKEPAAHLLLDALGKEQFLTCDMCLGEGTGAVMLFPLLDMAEEVYTKMSTFEDDDIEAYTHLN